MIGHRRVAADGGESDDDERGPLLASGAALESGDRPASKPRAPGSLLFGEADQPAMPPGGGGDGGGDDGGGAGIWGEGEDDRDSSRDRGYKLLDDCIMATEGKFQIMLTTLNFVANFVDAAEVFMLGLLYPTLAKQFGLEETELALISSMTNFGMFVGALVFGRLSDVYGRRLTVIVSMVVTMFFGFVSSFASTLVTFSVLRFFLGMGYGGNLITATVLLVEFVDHENRGKYVMVGSLGFGIGALSISGISWAVIPHIGWQWLLRIAALMALPALIMLYWVPESPRFFLMKRKYDKCVETMQYVADYNSKVLPANFNAVTLRMVHDEEEGDDDSRTWRKCWGLREMFQWPVMKTLLPLAMCWFLNNFASVIVQWMPIHGKESFPAQTNIVYEISLLQSAGMVVGSVSQIFIVQKVSRLLQIRIGFILCALITLLIGLLGMQSVAALLTLSFCVTIAQGYVVNTLYLYSPEAFPTLFRVTAFGVCMTAHRIAPIISPYAVAALDKIGFNVTCFVFGSLYFAGFLFSLLVRVSTFGKPLVEHSDLFGEEDKLEKDKFKEFASEAEAPSSWMFSN